MNGSASVRRMFYSLRPSKLTRYDPPRACSHLLPREHGRTTQRAWQYTKACAKEPQKCRSVLTIATATTFIYVVWTTFYGRAVHAETHESATAEDRTELYRLAEVSKHDRNADRIWVTKGCGVYDITEWVPMHPGGEVILQAAGGSIDPYWNIFNVHKKQDVYDILEGYRIGFVDPRDLIDGEVSTEHIEDPFAGDPERDQRLLVHTSRPCNAETPAGELEAWKTPNSVFYVRNHFWVPEETSADDYELTVELFDGEEKKYTLKDLKENFQPYTITAVLQCSGNRRSHMSKNARPASGLPWDVGAIGNAEWTGVRLRDVLADAGFSVNDPDPEVKHVHFIASEVYAASIPIAKAVDRLGDVVLAYAMNGEPLPRDHGFPLRALVPGTVAARSVKWLNKISLSDEESGSQWQRRDYKCFGPNQKEVDWDSAPSIQEMPVQSAITSLQQKNGETVADGYAYSGGGRAIARVDVSADDGKTWHQAELLPSQMRGSKVWSWTRWQFRIPSSQAGKVFVVKAVDEAYNTQPDSYEPLWNIRGNLTSAWHKVPNEPKQE